MKKRAIADLPQKPAVLKRVSPKVVGAADSLFALQRQIDKLGQKMAALKAQEEELVAELAPVFGELKASAKFSIPRTASRSLEIRYTYVDRLVTDGEKVERILTRLGKAVPKRHNIYSFIRAVEVKTPSER